MCMLFFLLNPNPAPDGYLLILANIRDEFYKRPTRQCHFWDKKPNCIGGTDAETETAGGTWLGMSTEGKIASLLNVMKPINCYGVGHRTRGFLAVDFLESNFDGPSFLKNLKRGADDYSAFLLVTLEVSPSIGQVRASHYSNVEDEMPTILKPGVHAFGNCSPTKPWMKVKASKRRFAQIVAKSRSVRRKEQLIEDLFEFLMDKKEYYPDPQLQNDADGWPDDYRRGLSSVFVNIEDDFGSRTHSLILVDANGKVDFVEKTMKEPVNPTSDQWESNRHQFTIQDRPSQIQSRL